MEVIDTLDRLIEVATILWGHKKMIITERVKKNIKENLVIIAGLRIEMLAVLDNLKDRDLRNNIKHMLTHLKWRTEYLESKIKAIEEAEKDKRMSKALRTALEILNE